ncbi:MAG: chloride channel protein [Bacteroidetes bacterium]|nr:chloride channel protein [Bacteroidota bacterium]
MENLKTPDDFFQWARGRVSHRYLIMILSLVIGLLTGLSAVVLKYSVYYLRVLLTVYLPFSKINFLILLFPLVGVLVSFILVRYWIKDNITHGISRILYAISRGGGRLKKHDLFSSMAGSTITVGFGGSVGLEAPIVLTGSAIGSNLGKLFRLEYKSLVLLIGCGAAGAIAGIFKAPIAGVAFALEVLMLDLTMSSLIPLLIASVSGATLAGLLMGKGVLFSFTLTESYGIIDLPFFILLGILSGLISLYFTRTNLYIEEKFEKITSGWSKVILGGLTLSILVFLFPPLFGEGYDSLMELLSGKGSNILTGSFFNGISSYTWVFLIILFLVLLLKVVAMSVTTAAGGIGGVFAPTLFVGGITGYFLTAVVQKTGLAELSGKNYALVGMAGVMAGVMHAPLTAIFLIAEATGGYNLLIPLMITATIAFITISYFEPHSLYTKRLAEKGQLMTRNKDKAILSQMKIDNLIETNFNTVGIKDYLGDLVREISRSDRNVFPVVDKESNFEGLIFINDIRSMIFKQELYGKVLVKDLMYIPDAVVQLGESMEEVARKFHDTENYNLPVLDHGKYVGFVSRANVFSAYREILKDASEE